MKPYPQLEVPPAWHDLIKRVHAAGLSEGVIAGGALRDLDNNVAPKDIDVFVWDRGKERNQEMLAGLWPEDAISTDVPRHVCNYLSSGDVSEVLKIDHDAVLVPVQIVFLRQRQGPAAIADRCDFGISRIIYGGTQPFITDDYLIDKALKRFTILRADNKDDLERSERRFVRISERYPEWELVIPEWLYRHATGE